MVNGEVIAQRIVQKDERHAKLEIEYTAGKSAWIAARAHQLNGEDTRKGVSFAKRRDVGGGPAFFNRYYGTLRPETPFAHTSPIYVVVNKQPIRSKADADYFIRYLQNSIQWLQRSGRFPSSEAKKEVLAAFRKGIQAYKDLGK